MIKFVYILGTAMLAVPLAAVPMKNVHGWDTWQRKDDGGKVERIKPAPNRNGMLKLLPDPGKKQYLIKAYGADPAEPAQFKKYVAKFDCSADLNSGVNISFSLRAKNKSRSWYDIFPKPVSASIIAVPGESQQITLEVDLKPLKANEIASVVPMITVSGLTDGTITITEIDVETSISKWVPPVRPSGPGLKGYTLRENALKTFSWPTPIALEKFSRMIKFSAVGLNIFKLTPDMKGAAIQWPDGTTIQAEYKNNAWQISSGKAPQLKVTGSISGSDIAAAFDGTGIIFKTADGKMSRFEGGFESTDAALLMPATIPTPDIKKLDIIADALLYCSADEAEMVLETAAKLYKQEMPNLKKAWGTNSQESSWNTKLAFYRQAVAKAKAQAVAATDGFIPVLAADPILRDRYNWLIWMASSQFTDEGGYFGGQFRKLWFDKLSGRGDLYSAMLFAQKLEKLVARSRRVSGAAFDEGVADSSKTLAGSFVSALELVPQPAGLPANLKKNFNLRAARSEAESVNLVLTTAATPVDNVSLEVTADDAGAPEVRMEKVAYISLTETANPQLPLSRGGDVKEPDVCIPLSAGEAFNIASYTNQPILLTAQCAGDTNPGDYSYTVKVNINGSEAFTLPLTLKVEAVKLGKRIPSLAGFRSSTINQWYKENPQKARKNLFRTLQLYRMEPLDFYVLTPQAEDFEWALQNDLQAANLGGSLDALAQPEPGMVKFIELYGSTDGSKFVRIPADVQLVTRDPQAVISDQDLVVTPKAPTAQYKFLKLHYSETRGWYDRVGYSFFVIYPSQGAVLDINQSEKVRDVRIIQPDTDVLNSGYADGKSVRFMRFDSLRNESNRGSVIWENKVGAVRNLRLINRRIEIALPSIKNNLERMRKLAGKDFPIYLYGYDEIASHLNGRFLSSLKHAKKLFPDVKLISSAANAMANPEIFDYLDIVSVANAYALPRYEASISKNKRTKFWTYVGGGGYYPFGNFERVDQPRINSRAFFWELITFDHIEGFGYWDIHMWRHNNHLIPQKDKGIDWSLWNPTFGDLNGMGALFYPGKNFTIYPGMRASAIRDGIEDAELFRQARDLVKSEADKAELESIRNGFARSMSVYCKDFNEVENLRSRLFDLLRKVSR